MKNNFGLNLTITLFGESHGDVIGAVLDGVPAGIRIDYGYIESKMKKRLGIPGISTDRKEPDRIKFVSGVFGDFTSGTPLTVIIENRDVIRSDYDRNKKKPRPSHADLTQSYKYLGFADLSGGGHASGRLTAPIVALGAMLEAELLNRGVRIGAHLCSLGDVHDRPFDDLVMDIDMLSGLDLPVLDQAAAEDMRCRLASMKETGDSIGGIVECAIDGIPKGLGEPWFDTVEGLLAHAMLSIPGCKGIEFGSGFRLARMRGSEANDTPTYLSDNVIGNTTNNMGGVDGGITNGMPIIFRTVFKPTPSIMIKQRTVDLEKAQACETEPTGRHDPAIAPRAAVVVEALAAITVADLLLGRFGTNYLGADL